MSKVSISCLIAVGCLVVSGCNPESGSNQTPSADSATGTSFADLVDANLLSERTTEIIPPANDHETIHPVSDPADHTAIELGKTYFGEFQHDDEFMLRLDPGRYTLSFRGIDPGTTGTRLGDMDIFYSTDIQHPTFQGENIVDFHEFQGVGDVVTRLLVEESMLILIEGYFEDDHDGTIGFTIEKDGISHEPGPFNGTWELTSTVQSSTQVIDDEDRSRTYSMRFMQSQGDLYLQMIDDDDNDYYDATNILQWQPGIALNGNSASGNSLSFRSYSNIDTYYFMLDELEVSGDTLSATSELHQWAFPAGSDPYTEEPLEAHSMSSSIVGQRQ